MSIDAGDRWVEAQINERERVGRYMYEHQSDYVKQSHYEEVKKQLTEAKCIIQNILHALINKDSEYTFALKNTHPVFKQAEQFLKEA